jgi:hypothetical protein
MDLNNEAAGTLWETLECGKPQAIDARPRSARTGTRLPPLVEAAIRGAYFSEAGELALRYRVSVADVVAHLEGAGLGRMQRPERAIEHIRCAVHATALMQGNRQAWTDVVNALAPGFDRACASRLEPQRGIAFARRFWIDLQCSSIGELAVGAPGLRPGDRPAVQRPRGVRAPDLRTFAAIRPLRYWLAERLLGSLEVELGRAASEAECLDTEAEVRTLRIPALAR